MKNGNLDADVTLTSSSDVAFSKKIMIYGDIEV